MSRAERQPQKKREGSRPAAASGSRLPSGVVARLSCQPGPPLKAGKTRQADAICDPAKGAKTFLGRSMGRRRKSPAQRCRASRSRRSYRRFEGRARRSLAESLNWPAKAAVSLLTFTGKLMVSAHVLPCPKRCVPLPVEALLPIRKKTGRYFGGDLKPRGTRRQWVVRRPLPLRCRRTAAERSPVPPPPLRRNG